VLETFHGSYGLDGTILGLPGGPVHLEIVRLPDPRHPARGLDQLVFYLPDETIMTSAKTPVIFIHGLFSALIFCGQ